MSILTQSLSLNLREGITINTGKIRLAGTRGPGQRLPLTHGMLNLGMSILMPKLKKRD